MRVPKLRFKEFSGGWQVNTIGCIASSVSAGATPSTTKREYWGGDIRWMNSGELNLKRVYEVANRITEAGLKNSSTKILPVESVLIGLAGQGKTRGTVAINYVPLCTNQSIAAIQPNPKYFIPEFLYQNLDNRYLELRSMSTGDGGRGGLNLQIIKSVPISLPGIPEQKKIATFLSSIDQKITLLTKNHELLNQYKKGVMQKFFSQEIRFKDKVGNDFPEWKSCKFDEIYDFYPTNSLSRDKLNYERGDIFNIHYGDIHTKFKTRFELKNEVVPFVNEGALGVKFKPDSYCRPGDLVIADASEDYKDVGKAIEVIDVDNKKITAGLHTYIARDKNHQMALGFGGCLMQSAPVRQQIKFLATGTSVLSISKTNLSKIDLLIPSKSEQTAISDCLAKFDKKIEVIESQLELTKKYKQGLLQQMFI